MKNQLHTFNVLIPLRYYTYDLHSEDRDSEYVMGLKQDVEWDVDVLVEEPIQDTDRLFRKQEKTHFHLFCEKDKEVEGIPADYFCIEISNIIAHDKEEARLFIKNYIYKICRTLSFLLSKYNCNKHSYQPRVEADMEHSVWQDMVYEPFQQLISEDEDIVEIINADGKKYQIITLESAPIVVSASVYTKIYGNMPVDDFMFYIESTDADLNFMLDEFYLALGQENRYSKFFHLYSIIEFVENRYEDMNGANKLLDGEEIDSIINEVSRCQIFNDKMKRERVIDTLMRELGKLTDIGRKDKLVNILHHMGIERIENCGTVFEINHKTINPIIRLRNHCYHGGTKKVDQTYIDVDLAVTQLMYICEKIIMCVSQWVSQWGQEKWLF